jgi:hypothetical protein
LLQNSFFLSRIRIPPTGNFVVYSSVNDAGIFLQTAFQDIAAAWSERAGLGFLAKIRRLSADAF